MRHSVLATGSPAAFPATGDSRSGTQGDSGSNAGQGPAPTSPKSTSRFGCGVAIRVVQSCPWRRGDYRERVTSSSRSTRLVNRN